MGWWRGSALGDRLSTLTRHSDSFAPFCWGLSYNFQDYVHATFFSVFPVSGAIFEKAYTYVVCYKAQSSHVARTHSILISSQFNALIRFVFILP